MKREIVLGTLVAAGALSTSVAALQQAPAAAGQPAPRVVEVDKLKDNLADQAGLQIKTRPAPNSEHESGTRNPEPGTRN